MEQSERLVQLSQCKRVTGDVARTLRTLFFMLYSNRTIEFALNRQCLVS